MSFAVPIWFWALAPIPLAVLARVWGALEGRDAVDHFVAPRLRDDLVAGPRSGSGWWRFSALVTGYALIIAALAQPRWGETEREVFGEGRSLMLAIDTSRSMLADDLKPNRLTRAKLAAQDLVSALPGDQIGLIAFAGGSYVQVPITGDRSALADAIDQLDTYAVARGGTNIGNAIKLASASLIDSGAAEHALVLFTDGENLEGEALDEAADAAGDGMVIVTVGIGSSEGSMIPDPDSRRPGGDFVRDGDGEIVRSRLDIAALEKIARAADGQFIHLDQGALNTDIISQALAQLTREETEAGVQSIPTERYQWPLGSGLVLLCLPFLARLRRAPRAVGRNAATAAATLLVCASLASARGGAIADAFEGYQSGEYGAAVEHFEEAIAEESRPSRRERLQLGLGSAAFRSGDHDRALEAFAEALASDDRSIQEHAHYNLGNTLFRTGENRLAEGAGDSEDAPPAPPSKETAEATLRDWRGAEEHYQATLDSNPGNADAAHNLDVVRRRIEELERQREEKEQQEQENEDPEENPDPSEDEKPDEPGNDEEQPKEDEPEEDPQGEPDEPGSDSDPGGEGQEPPDTPANPEPDPEPGEAESGKQEPGEGDPQPGEAIPGEPSEEVNPETGYSEEEARRQLEALANEQADLQPIRRRVRARFFKDW